MALNNPPSTYVARRFEASSPDAQVLGAAFVAFFQHIKKDETSNILNKLGLTEIDPNEWYPQQTFLNFYKLAEAAPSIMQEDFVSIGMKFVDTIPFPDEVQTIQEALHALNDMNRNIHRNIPTEERWLIEDKTDKSIIVKYNMPYHENAAYGYLWAVAKRFCKTNFVVRPTTNPINDAPFAYEVNWK